jgi:shikimate dehydrogenase
MQNAGLAAAGLAGWRYQLLPVPPDVFAETVAALPAAGFRGVNVTIPHKEAALAVADAASAPTRAIGAANTLLFEPDGRVMADNTDAPALIAAIPLPVRGATALVLGAGGSARAAVWALLDAGAAEVRVWNRTPERAQRMCAELGGTPTAIAEPADLLLNDSTFKQLPLRADDLGGYRCVVDLVYREAETPLVKAARARSVQVVDGLELLLDQGTLAFERFTGQPAPVQAMRAALMGT